MSIFQHRVLLILLFAGCLLQVGLLTGSSFPLGVPGEWVWSRIPTGTILGFNVGFTIFILLVYFFFLRAGISSIEKCNSFSKSIWLIVLCLASMVVIWNLKTTPGNIYGSAGMSWVTYYPRMSGYYTEAVSSKKTTVEFLASYEQTAAQGDYLHQGTHPPGLIVCYRLLHGLCEKSPTLTRWIIASEPLEISDGLNVITEINRNGNSPLTQPQRATLWLSVLVTLLLCASTVIPIYVMLSRTTSAAIAFGVSGLFALVPAVAMFAPKSDLLLAFIACWLAMLWVQAVTTRNLLLGFLAGFVLWVGMIISLAIIVVPVILTLWTLLNLHQTQPEKLNFSLLKKIPLLVFIAIFTGLAMPCLLMWGLFDLNLISVWAINLGKHSEFYDHNSRTYFLWLLVNPLEMAFSLGMPLFIIALFSFVQSIRHYRKNVAAPISLAVFFVWLLLLVSGKNMGEAARLWIFLLPLMLCATAPIWNTIKINKPENSHENFPILLWTTLYFTQAVVAIISLCTIDAFDFTAV